MMSSSQPSPKRNIEVTWSIAHATGDYYTITNEARGWRLTGTADNYPGRTDVNWVVESSAAVSDAQLWQIAPAGDGFYRMKNKQFDMLLHGTAPGTRG